MESRNVPAAPLTFQQPKLWVRWLAVVLAAAGWYVSLELLRVSGGAAAGPFMEAVCGGGKGENALDDCSSVLTSPQAYVRISPEPSAPKMPVSTLGMAYFAVVALWYLFVGPPTRDRRYWHLLIAVIVVYGAWQSVDYIRIMKYELHRWCAGCLVAHALNGGLLVLTLLAYPWRSPAKPTQSHPSGRLVGAVVTAGVLAFVTHLLIAYLMIARTIMTERNAQLAAIMNDPAYVLWDFNRQPVVSIPLADDEVFAGDPAAPNTLVVFGDFQCPACRQLHETLREVAGKHPGAFRVAFRYYPQDPECNPNPAYRSGDHASACRAARAAEAARVLGGREGYLAMRDKLWNGQAELPTRPYVQQPERERKLFEDWAAEIGLDRAAFTAAMDSPPVVSRIQTDIDLATRLGLQSMPVVYVNGRLLRGWSKPETWDVILGGNSEPVSQPAAAPVAQ
jgi:protein-disulfide isomerase